MRRSVNQVEAAWRRTIFGRLLDGNTEAMGIARGRLQFLLEGINLPELLLRQIRGMGMPGMLDLKEKDLKRSTVVLFGGFPRLPLHEQPSDIDIYVIVPNSMVKFTKPDLAAADGIPPVDIVIHGIPALRSNEKAGKELAQILSESGLVLYGHNMSGKELGVRVDARDSLARAAKFMTQAAIIDSLLEAGVEREWDSRREWNKLFEAYLIIRPLVLMYAPEKAADFEKRIFGMNVAEFYQKLYLRNLDLPWEGTGASRTMTAFAGELDKLMRVAGRASSSSPANGLRQKLAEALAGVSLEQLNKLVVDAQKRIKTVHHMDSSESLEPYEQKFFEPLAVEFGFADERELYLAVALDVVPLWDIYDKELKDGLEILAWAMDLESSEKFKNPAHYARLQMLLITFPKSRIPNIDTLIAAVGSRQITVEEIRKRLPSSRNTIFVEEAEAYQGGQFRLHIYGRHDRPALTRAISLEIKNLAELKAKLLKNI